ncbi:MAG: Gfo/Idh/MocA family oxidoreductase [Pirellulaceae bacterium]|nr:Gfo/Idh/MocA family oxidoreductase [Pirellulaceae bacterium]
MTAPRRVLIVGVGSIGQRHVRCFLATGRVEVAICETDAEQAERVAGQYPVTAVHRSLDDAVQQGYDAAVICTPAPLHVPQASQLAGAGWHLLIEKPLSTSLAGIDDLLRIVRERNLVAGVAYVHRAHPVLADMRAALDAGRFGPIVQLVAVSGQHFPTYRPAYRQIYYARHATGGGAIQDALTHMLNAGEWLAGPIDRLVADAAHQVLPDVEVEDTVHLIARQGRVLSSYSLNQHQAPNELTLTVVCRDGTARYVAHEGRWLWMTEPGADWQVGQARPLERDELFVLQAEAFLDAVEGRRPPPCSLEAGLQTLRVNLAALEAVRSQSWQSVV